MTGGNAAIKTRKPKTCLTAAFVLLAGVLSGCSEGVGAGATLPSLTATSFADHGSANEQTDVKLTAAAALTAEVNVASVDPSKATLSRSDILDYISSPDQASKRRAELLSLFSKSLANKKADSITRALRENVGSSEDVWKKYQGTSMYGGARMAISRWLGVYVAEGSARVSLEGTQKYYLWSGTVRAGYPTRYQLVLKKSNVGSRGWVVSKEIAHFIKDGP